MKKFTTKIIEDKNEFFVKKKFISKYCAKPIKLEELLKLSILASPIKKDVIVLSDKVKKSKIHKKKFFRKYLTDGEEYFSLVEGGIPNLYPIELKDMIFKKKFFYQKK